MNAGEEMRAYCMAKTEVTEDHPWGHDVWKVYGKIFAILGDEAASISLKNHLESQAALCQDPLISIPPYVGHKGWICIDLTDPEGIPLAKEFIDVSYELVVRTLPKKHQRRILGE